jgi:hypothetical protein
MPDAARREERIVTFELNTIRAVIEAETDYYEDVEHGLGRPQFIRDCDSCDRTRVTGRLGYTFGTAVLSFCLVCQPLPSGRERLLDFIHRWAAANGSAPAGPMSSLPF